jgi:hypothetical protein
VPGGGKKTRNCSKIVFDLTENRQGTKAADGTQHDAFRFVIWVIPAQGGNPAIIVPHGVPLDTGM